ncbi:MAG: hypothetical protein P8O76_00650 [Methylophilaceae bacterium]|nr:hypothetical protein [Methylophilaceae bacterium]
MKQTDTGMTQSPANESAKQKSGKKMLLGLAVVFVLPFTIAATLHLLDIRPGGKSFGNLITPPTALIYPTFEDAKGEQFAPSRWDKIWSIVMIDGQSCAEACQVNVDKLNRIHISLNKEFDRVQRILILDGEVDAEQLVALQTKYKDLIILIADSPAQQSFVKVFDDTSAKGSVFLVDPLGNLMMHYPSTLGPKELYSDMKRLLKNSWGG